MYKMHVKMSKINMFVGRFRRSYSFDTSNLIRKPFMIVIGVKVQGLERGG